MRTLLPKEYAGGARNSRWKGVDPVVSLGSGACFCPRVLSIAACLGVMDLSTAARASNWIESTC